MDIIKLVEEKIEFIQALVHLNRENSKFSSMTLERKKNFCEARLKIIRQLALINKKLEGETDIRKGLQITQEEKEVLRFLFSKRNRLLRDLARQDGQILDLIEQYFSDKNKIQVA